VMFSAPYTAIRRVSKLDEMEIDAHTARYFIISLFVFLTHYFSIFVVCWSIYLYSGSLMCHCHSDDTSSIKR
jgi:hypothetical protein